MTIADRPRLLLVEDDPVLGPLIAELLEPDYRVVLAANGQDGLHLGLTEPWDVMVIDRGLPVMDGIALITALRSKGISVPILILTALGDPSEKVRGLDAGANDYVTKPFDAGELAARLRALTRTFTPARRDGEHRRLGARSGVALGPVGLRQPGLAHGERVRSARRARQPNPGGSSAGTSCWPASSTPQISPG